MQNRVIYSLVFLLCVTALRGMEPIDPDAKKTPDSVLLVIQGYNKGGCTYPLLPEFVPQHIPTGQYSEHWHDLGQNESLAAIKESLQQLNLTLQLDLNKQCILYACGEGALTTLNYIEQEHTEQVKMLILDNAFASGNSAIFYNAQKKFPWVSLLPLSYYWLPYLAKFKMLLYSPAGKQPILNIQKISKDLPIMIVHAADELSFDHAKALYAGLRLHGNTNTYLFPVNRLYGFMDKESYNLTNTKQDEVLAIRKIMQNRTLLPDDACNVGQENNLEKKYQPEPDINAYNQLVAQENVFPYLDQCLKVTVFGLVLGICMYTVH